MKINAFDKTLKNGKILTVRNATTDDAKALLDYLKIVGQETDFLPFGFEGRGIDINKEMQDIVNFNNSPSSAMILGVIDGEIAGVFSIVQESICRRAHNVEFGCSVQKKFWRQGIANILMQEILSLAKTSKYIKVIRIKVIAQNERAISLYKKFGFKEVGKLTNYHKVDNNYFDTLLMELII